MENKENEEKPRFSNEQKQKIKKYAVFALMGIACAGSMWLIFAPSAENKAKKEQTAGFNTDIPLPKEEGLIGDKRDAYEQEQMKQKQAERMRSLEDFSNMIGRDSAKQSGDLVLLEDDKASHTKGEENSKKTTSVQKSVNAYNDMNRTLGNFYESPKRDAEKEQMKLELEDLKARMNETENRKNSTDEQMALMEKSFQMASKYIPLNSSSGNTIEQTAKVETNASGKTTVVPVTQFVEQAVSALPQEMSGKEMMQALAQPRNMGFLTVTADRSSEQKNTVSACVHSDQTVMDGESVRLRILEPMLAGKTLVRENTILSGITKIQGERLQITVHSLEYDGNIFPVEMFVYDTDGQEGIFIPDTKEINAAKEIAANMGTNAGTSINLSNDAGKQFAADMGRNLIQGVSQFFSKKMQEVKVNLKAGYRIFLVVSG